MIGRLGRIGFGFAGHPRAQAADAPDCMATRLELLLERGGPYLRLTNVCRTGVGHTSVRPNGVRRTSVRLTGFLAPIAIDTPGTPERKPPTPPMA